MPRLYKTTLVIWSEFDAGEWTPGPLGDAANMGEQAHCSKQEMVTVENPEEDPDWDGEDWWLTESK